MRRKYPGTTCTVDGCDRQRHPSAGGGMCAKHYQRLRKYGDPLYPVKERLPKNPDRGCAVPGCEEPHRMLGHCAAHAKRFVKYGDPTFVPTDSPSLSIDERFLRYRGEPDPVTGCMEWQGEINIRNYGVLNGPRGGKRRTAAHRYALMREGIVIPNGMHVDHVCRNTRCVNPEHLEVVSARDNVVVRSLGPSGVNSRKRHCKRGHPLAGDNLVIASNGSRICRTCRNARARERYQAKTRTQST